MAELENQVKDMKRTLFKKDEEINELRQLNDSFFNKLDELDKILSKTIWMPE
ncbi:7927_t:CDS:2 [Scutellospora calospora]|uniref:7927_t:CDS:1 n=1 Tax=Scutellospora calospora TaxID=85575 RepID=A0ACA9PFM7_9GLOM|nr:7927_t:CDS:2 [Scutellospora calospora]